MKVKIECLSPLLQKTLEYYLRDYINPQGVLITDNPEKDGIIIGKEIKKPFSKISLMLQLEKLINTKPDFEEEFERIFNDFKNELKKLLKEHYGKRQH